jgi:hypothetical protein
LNNKYKKKTTTLIVAVLSFFVGTVIVSMWARNAIPRYRPWNISARSGIGKLLFLNFSYV